MALPVDGELVTRSITGRFLAPRDHLPEPFEFYERGGIGIQDPTLGLDLYDWRFRIDAETGEVFVGVPDTVAETFVYTIEPLPVQCAGSFDTNMNIVLAWVDTEGDAFLRWWDPVIPDYRNIELPAGVRDVRCALDDVRDSQALTGVTDTIVAYMVSGRLCYRQLRDRFETEIELADDLEEYRLVQIGMNRMWRFQFMLTHRPEGA